MPRTTLALFALVPAAALALAGCSSNETETTDGADAPAESSESSDTAAAESSADIVGEEVTYESGGVTLKGYIAYDASIEGTRPGVLGVHEWWGHNEYTRDRARALAAMGYTALAVDMYGDGKLAEHPDTAGEFAREVFANMDEGVARFMAGKTFLNEHATTDPTKTAAIGYCFGGGVVLHMAREGLDLAAVAAFHAGGLESGNDPANITGRVFVAHGADDPLVSAETIESFKANMDAAGIEYTFTAYPGATHSFTNPGADAVAAEFGLPLAYQKEADEQSWATMSEMFEEAFADAAGD